MNFNKFKVSFLIMVNEFGQNKFGSMKTDENFPVSDNTDLMYENFGLFARNKIKLIEKYLFQLRINK